MCGIAGIISLDNKVQLTQVIKQMTDVIAHRGPDGEGFFVDENKRIALGHRRLSILDLNAVADQPMKSEDGRYIIIFNGEIYNYLELKQDLLKQGVVFRTSSDTEVLLKAYILKGERCLEELDGMFAFAVYDSIEQVLFCACDRFGEKPFFFHFKENNTFQFASEMKALWRGGVQRSINNTMLFNYVTSGLVQNPRNISETFFDGIYRLKPAHYLKISLSECRILSYNEYWSLKNISVKEISQEEAIYTFKSLFETSVCRRLRSDVPVGSSLSGGLDSSLIVMLIDRIKREPQVQKTFSARFPSFSRDEGKYMMKVIERCNVDPYFTYPNEDSLVSEIEKIFYHQEEPFGSASIYAQFEVMKLAKSHGVKVLLDGQGADEILAGYPGYFASFHRELKKQDQKLYRKEIQASRKLQFDKPFGLLQKYGLKGRIMNGAAFMCFKKTAKKVLQEWYPSLNYDFYHNYLNQSFFAPTSFNSLNEHLYYSTMNYGLGQLLRYADRNSMANSVEVRLPFLSHQLVEFLFSLEGNFKIREGWTKWLMRKAYNDLFPIEIGWRKDKIGYEPPQNQWLKHSAVKDIIEEKKKLLVAHGVLHRNILKLEYDKINANNAWTYWMAGNLVNS